MLHNILIILHAAAGVASFVAGCLVLLPPTERSSKGWLFLIYFASLMALVGFLLAAIAVDWSDLDFIQRLVFSGLALLGLYMAWRAIQAKQVLRRRQEGWKQKYVDHVGFTLISLFDGFVIVSAIDLKAPGWLVGGLAVLGVVVGIGAINAVKSKLPRSERAQESF
jgi:amino acid transporter